MSELAIAQLPLGLTNLGPGIWFLPALVMSFIYFRYQYENVEMHPFNQEKLYKEYDFIIGEFNLNVSGQCKEITSKKSIKNKTKRSKTKMKRGNDRCVKWDKKFETKSRTSANDVRTNIQSMLLIGRQNCMCVPMMAYLSIDNKWFSYL